MTGVGVYTGEFCTHPASKTPGRSTMQELSAADRDLVIQFANRMRDLNLIRLIHKPIIQVSRNKFHKSWTRIKTESIPVIADTIRILRELRNSTNPELQTLAERSISRDQAAHDSLRRLGVRIKQDLY